jgi:methyl-accepting chemotaxis protein
MRWTIRGKLYCGFGMAGLLVLGCVGLARWQSVAGAATEKSVIDTYRTLNDLEHIVSYVRGVTAMTRAYLVSGDDRSVAGIPAMRLDANQVMARVEETLRSDAEQSARFARFREALRLRRLFTNKLVAARQDGFPAAKVLFETGEDDRLLGLMQVEADAMRDQAVAQLATQQAAYKRLQQEMIWVEGLTVVLGGVLLIAIAATVTRLIGKNILVSMGLLEAMAAKNLAVEDGKPEGEDEMAEAIHAINRSKQSMAVALAEVSEASTRVAHAGAGIESSATQIATSTRREQGNVAHFASSLAQMNASVKEVADHADRASVAAGDAVSSATTGRELVRQTHQAMNRIHESVHTASGDITTLGAETESIGQVVKIIQDIAEQTNLLALNAAIEAARAGTQGKGFAVVAQEVRQLAERTAKFTQEVAVKVDSVQKGANRAIQSMEQGAIVVTDGVRQFNEVSEALEAIVHRIESAQQGIAMIASATTQQSEATAGLTHNIHEISTEIEQTAGIVDQTAQACTELAREAEGLQRVVDSFRLPTTERGGRSKAGGKAKWQAA